MTGGIDLKIKDGHIQQANFGNSYLNYEYDRASDNKYDFKTGTPTQGKVEPYKDAPRKNELELLTALSEHIEKSVEKTKKNVINIAENGKTRSLNYDQAVDYIDDRIAELTLSRDKKKGVETLKGKDAEDLKELVSVIVKANKPYSSNSKGVVTADEIDDINKEAKKYGFTIGTLKDGQKEIDIFKDKDKKHLVGTVKVDNIDTERSLGV